MRCDALSLAALAFAALCSCGLATAGIPDDGPDAASRDASIDESTAADAGVDTGADASADVLLCDDATTACGNVCVETARDLLHCGACNTACVGGDAACVASVWPSAGENRSCNCSSSGTPVTPLAAKSQSLRMTILAGRGTVVVTQEPSVANGFTAVVEFNDPPAGADWYEVLLGYETI